MGGDYLGDIKTDGRIVPKIDVKVKGYKSVD
jgi:hypothetical protein